MGPFTLFSSARLTAILGMVFQLLSSLQALVDGRGRDHVRVLGDIHAWHSVFIHSRRGLPCGSLRSEKLKHLSNISHAVLEAQYSLAAGMRRPYISVNLGISAGVILSGYPSQSPQSLPANTGGTWRLTG